jgi:protein CpxP
MKKIGIVLMLLVGVSAIAQRGEKRSREGMKDLTPEQVATLQTKKATLALDLSEIQQGQMNALLLEKATMRKTKMDERKAQKEKDETKKRTSEERYALANERLDYQIAQKGKLKNILSDEQYEKWGKMQHRKGKHHKGRGEKHKGAKNKKE